MVLKDKILLDILSARNEQFELQTLKIEMDLPKEMWRVYFITKLEIRLNTNQ